MGCVDRLDEFREITANIRQSSPNNVSKTNSVFIAAQTPAPELFNETAHHLMTMFLQKEKALKMCKESYLCATQFGAKAVTMMSDVDRESLETDILDFAREFGKSLSALEETLHDGTANGHIDQHCDLVVSFLYARIKAMTEEIQEMRKSRVSRKNQQEKQLNPKVLRASAMDLVKASLVELDSIPETQERQFSESQIQEFEEENKALLEELDSEMDTVRQAERRLHEIAEMMTLFSSKVVQQQQQIENIYDNTISANTHLERGLVQLLHSLKYGAQYRANILFIFVLAGCSLLFLDWFQD